MALFSTTINSSQFSLYELFLILGGLINQICQKLDAENDQQQSMHALHGMDFETICCNSLSSC